MGGCGTNTNNRIIRGYNFRMEFNLFYLEFILFSLHSISNLCSIFCHFIYPYFFAGVYQISLQGNTSPGTSNDVCYSSKKVKSFYYFSTSSFALFILPFLSTVSHFIIMHACVFFVLIWAFLPLLVYASHNPVLFSRSPPNFIVLIMFFECVYLHVN